LKHVKYCRHRAALVRTDVSGEHIASIIRVTRIGELRTMLEVTSNRRTLLITANIVPSSPIFVALMMEVIHFSETSVLIKDTRRNIPKDDILHSHVVKTSTLTQH
jgi:hypothetical protein